MGTVKLDAVEATASQTLGHSDKLLDKSLDVGGRHHVGYGPAECIGLVRHADRRAGRTPELLPPRMPQLTDEDCARVFDRLGGALEGIIVDIVEAGDYSLVGKRLGIDRDDLGDDEGATAFSPVRRETQSTYR